MSDLTQLSVAQCAELLNGKQISSVELCKAFIDQLNQFEHVIMANCCTEPVARLCEELSKLSPGLERVYLQDISSANAGYVPDFSGRTQTLFPSDGAKPAGG